MYSKFKYIIFLIVVALFLSSCVAGANKLEGTIDAEGAVAGFWHGLWHGAIILITFIISLFNDKVSVYEVHNNGIWYNLGFVLGAVISLGGSHAASRGKKEDD